jgi:tetratricopeptide (TPR) repeat protein
MSPGWLRSGWEGGWLFGLLLVAATLLACLAHNSLGNILLAQGQTDDAMTHFQMALDIQPDYELAHNNIGWFFSKGTRRTRRSLISERHWPSGLTT